MRVSTDSLKTALVILERPEMGPMPKKNTIDLIKDLLEARELIHRNKIRIGKEIREEQAAARVLRQVP